MHEQQIGGILKFTQETHDDAEQRKASIILEEKSRNKRMLLDATNILFSAEPEAETNKNGKIMGYRLPVNGLHKESTYLLGIGKMMREMENFDMHDAYYQSFDDKQREKAIAKNLAGRRFVINTALIGGLLDESQVNLFLSERGRRAYDTSATAGLSMMERDYNTSEEAIAEEMTNIQPMAVVSIAGREIVAFPIRNRNGSSH